MPSFLERLFFWQKPRREQFQETLSAIENGRSDARYVQILLEALQWNKKAHEQAERALIQLLPRLQSRDAHILDWSQRKLLYRYLALSTPNRELTLSLLKSLENVGDSTACDNVQYLAQATSHTADEQVIIRAAQICLPILEERAKQVMQAGTLLRSSGPPRHLDDLLLQPSSPPSILSSTARTGPEDDQTPVINPLPVREQQNPSRYKPRKRDRRR
jgi:hypothetical protein